MSDADKQIIWVGSAKDDISAFPRAVKDDLGFQLWQVQQGRLPAKWRPMPTVGSGVVEIVLHGDDAYRVFYVAKYQDAIYVLHAFQKTTQQTSQNDLNLGRQRYRAVERQQQMRKAQESGSGRRKKK